MFRKKQLPDSNNANKEASPQPLLQAEESEKDNSAFAQLTVVVNQPKPKFGQPKSFDPNFKGPIKNRRCTDVICLLPFFGFLAFWLYIAIFAFCSGNLEQIMHPTDSRGETCGSGLAKDRPYLFYFDLTQCMGPQILVTGCTTPSVCVSSCPDKSFSMMELMSNPLSVDTSRLICMPDVDKSQIGSLMELSGYVASQQCASYYFPSGAINFRCFPGLSQNENGNIEVLEDTSQHVAVDSDNQTVTSSDAGNASSWMKTFVQVQLVSANVVQDYQVCWWMILIGLLIALILSFVWIMLMRWIAGPMAWLAIAGIIGVLTAGSYYTFSTYVALRTVQGADAHMSLTLDFSTYLTMQDTWLAFGIILAIILSIIVLLTIYLRKRIQIAIAMLEEGSRAIGKILSTLFFPLLPLFLQALTITWAAGIAMFLFSSGHAIGTITNSTNNNTQGSRNNDTCDPNNFNDTSSSPTGANCHLIKYFTDPYLLYYQIGNLFGLFWLTFFVTALSEMTLAGAFASYYWTWDKQHGLPRLPVLASLRRACRYHVGSLAFGSLIITIVRMIRVMLNYVKQKLRKSGNAPALFVLKCCTCCIWCLEKILNLINKNAYIVIAIYGKNFCTAAKEAYLLLMRNILRVAALDSVTTFLLFMGKLVIVGILGVASFYFFSKEIPGSESYAPNLHYYYVPVITIVIGSYFVAGAFFDVYEMAIDTLFLCFLEDLEKNDGSNAKPYFMPKRLMELLGRKHTFVTPSAPTELELQASQEPVLNVSSSW